MEPDAIMARIGEAVARDYAGDRAGARAGLAALWDEIHPDGEALHRCTLALHRCTLAHYMADLQDDPHAELLWDRRALEAAETIAGDGASEYFPSLHLNPADDYRKLGEYGAAWEHLARAAKLAGALPEGGYGGMIRRGIAGVATQL